MMMKTLLLSNLLFCTQPPLADIASFVMSKLAKILFTLTLVSLES